MSAEPSPEPEFVAGIAARMPRKRVSAGALFRDAAGRVLVVEPTYKPTWEIPGGVVEAGEEPRAACVREVAEELGLALPVGGLLVVDWAPGDAVWGDALHFVFDGGVVDPAALDAARLPPDELSGWRLEPLEVVSAHVRPGMGRRLAAAAEARAPTYLVDGRVLSNSEH